MNRSRKCITGSVLLAVIMWANTITLTWLMILNRVPRDWLSILTDVFFVVVAIASSVAASERSTLR